jgi:dTDP-4-amino-4,6-dideoxygalactose transaminase
MDAILRIASEHKIAGAPDGERGLYVVEDAAQALTASYKGAKLGALSDFGCFSFHETKNFSMGEGGAIVLHSGEAIERAEIIREKGTDRSRFFRGQVDKYSWVSSGSSYLPSDILAAYLWSQFEAAEEIIADRLRTWGLYYDGLRGLGQEGKEFISLPSIPEACRHNGHMFFIKTANADERGRLTAHLKENGIFASHHYVPLHASKAGRRYCEFRGEDRYTTTESERLLRLPMYYGLTELEAEYVVACIARFYA